MQQNSSIVTSTETSKIFLTGEVLKDCTEDHPNSLKFKMVTEKNLYLSTSLSEIRLLVSNEHHRCFLQKKFKDHNKTYSLACQGRFQKPNSF